MQWLACLTTMNALTLIMHAQNIPAPPEQHAIESVFPFDPVSLPCLKPLIRAQYMVRAPAVHTCRMRRPLMSCLFALCLQSWESTRASSPGPEAHASARDGENRSDSESSNNSSDGDDGSSSSSSDHEGIVVSRPHVRAHSGRAKLPTASMQSTPRKDTTRHRMESQCEELVGQQTRRRRYNSDRLLAISLPIQIAVSSEHTSDATAHDGSAESCKCQGA
jgi:hypothetical protein